MTLLIYRGLPGSGKTTLAKGWVAADPTGRARVNRDSLRAMLHDSVHLGPNTERTVIAVRDATITALLRRGVDVACDDTNLPARTVRDLRKLAMLANVEFDVIDLTDVDVDECVKRDAARSRVVGETVIRDLWTRYIRGRQHPLPVPDEPTETSYGLPYQPDPSKPSAVMVDIDGTLALPGTRNPFDETRVHQDRPNLPVIAAVTAMWLCGHTIIFCSGRTEGCRDATARWLHDHLPAGIPVGLLYMRAVGDTRKDAVVKAGIFDVHIRRDYRVVCVFDDRDQVVRMWRSLGLTVFQVAEGAF